MNLLADIKSLISSVDSNIFLGDMPNTPNNLIVIYNTGGYTPELTLDIQKYDNPTFQVRVRNTSYATAYSKCESIKTILSTLSNTTINGSFYLSIRQTSDILSIGKDENGLSNLTINFEAKIKGGI